MFSLRPYADSDRDGVVATVKAVYDEYGFTWEAEGYHADLYDVPGHFPSDQGGFWVAEMDIQVVGCIGLHIFDPVPGEPRQLVHFDDQVRIAGSDCELCRLYVRPEARKSGVGSALAKTLIHEAQVRGQALLEIWSDKRFQEAHRLYQRFGATVVGDRICHDPDQSPEFGLCLQLQ